VSPSATHERLRRNALRLAWATVAWNVVEAAVSVWAGARAGSTALVGFGVDAGIETFSAVVVIWQLQGVEEDRERRAMRLIGWGFFLLAAWITVESVRDLLAASAPEPSPVGIGITVASLVVMPVLALAKRNVGTAMASRVVLADARETLLCTYLSAVVLAGLVLTAAFGWWWADPVAALAVAWLAIGEGREAWEDDD
jgi:divalent metal cation (Fe/Co/Zn/Cd) transporter